jgi:hypothetical protein
LARETSILGQPNRHLPWPQQRGELRRVDRGRGGDVEGTVDRPDDRPPVGLADVVGMNRLEAEAEDVRNKSQAVPREAPV